MPPGGGHALLLGVENFWTGALRLPM